MKNLDKVFGFIEAKAGKKTPLILIWRYHPETITKQTLKERGFDSKETKAWFELTPIVSEEEIELLAEPGPRSYWDTDTMYRAYHTVLELHKKYSLDKLTEEDLRSEGVSGARVKLFSLFPTQPKGWELRIILTGLPESILKLFSTHGLVEKITKDILLGIGIPKDKVEVYEIIKDEYGKVSQNIFTQSILSTFLKLGVKPSSELEKYLSPDEIVRWGALSIQETNSIRIGKKERRGRGRIGTYEDLKGSITNTISQRNVAAIAQEYGITWEEMMIYYVSQGERIATAFAILGKDKEGREFMYDRRETSSPGAGQTELHSKYGSIKVSTAIQGDPEAVLNKLFPGGKK